MDHVTSMLNVDMFMMDTGLLILENMLFMDHPFLVVGHQVNCLLVVGLKYVSNTLGFQEFLSSNQLQVVITI